MTRKRAVIFGAGDFARVARFYLQHDSDIDVAAFTVHEARIGTKELLDLPVVPYESILETHPPDDFEMLIGIGYTGVNQNRAAIFEEARNAGYRPLTYICSKATTWPGLEVQQGCFIFENNVIQPFVSIGENTVLWSGNHIGHDSTVGSHVFITSHVVVSGNCRIGDYSFLGVNATIRDGISVGHHAVVGAGATVLRDIEPGAVLKATATAPAPMTSTELRRI
jgi:sugar O-acyltransferase (sialic acid O-acetyltransferase NeuD family)